jgi:hypothetical protein
MYAWLKRVLGNTQLSIVARLASMTMSSERTSAWALPRSNPTARLTRIVAPPPFLHRGAG